MKINKFQNNCADLPNYRTKIFVCLRKYFEYGARK